MSDKNIERSEQAAQGITIGTQGNQGGTIPSATKGSNREKEGPDDRHIPNQDHSSATNEEKAEGNKKDQ